MTRAYFIHKETRKQTHIHTGSRVSEDRHTYSSQSIHLLNISHNVLLYSLSVSVYLCVCVCVCVTVQRPDCVKHAERTLTQNTTVTLDEYVPDRFLCTGGTPSQMDASSTKGTLQERGSKHTHTHQVISPDVPTLLQVTLVVVCS